ncbi:DUF4184 family protein [Microbacterium esteraromaticum]|uniref:DUF4184 family protein n=1 Tax=Microbacterium esteraromaticum TaxID=57043 RepID=A0A7D8AC06_9MICO|nr:DUF4184 family protein [Microbacterium esteraromaticum]QMU95762.1 DUF4184 family protein [Microbacterium esteraromaticum]
MPFTPSHAVIALPFARSPLVPAAIAIGAMTPDLPLFLRGAGISYGFTHDWPNVVWTALVALALLLVWRAVLRPAAVELAPDAIADRLPDDWRRTGADALMEVVAPRERYGRLLLMISLVLGVLSHIGWDMFTHEGRWGVAAIPALQEMWGPLAGYKWLQHGSSVVGLLLIGIFALRWLAARASIARPRLLPAWVRWTWLVSLPLVLVTAWLVGLAVLGPLDAAFTAQHLAYRVLPPACGLWGAATIALSVGIVVAAARRRKLTAKT